MRLFLISCVALSVAVVTGYYLLETRQSPEAPVEESAGAPEPETAVKAEVFAPATALSAGALIRPEDLRVMALDEDSVTSAMVRADDEGEALLHGAVARQPLAEGVPVARSATIQPGERGFLAAVLEPGKRAIAVPVSETSAVGGHILPGDRIDLIMTYQVSSDDAEAARDLRASETLLGKLRVLALDTELESGAREPRVGNTVTLEVSPKQAEVISLARRLGDLSLVLNPVRDAETAQDADAFAQPTMLRLARADADADAPESSAQESRTMTLDSDISSLLSLHFGVAPQPDAEESAEPAQEEQGPQRVRVRRGTSVSEVPITAHGHIAARADGPAAAPDADAEPGE